ncbi:hypothetical protein L3V43_23605, partial [Pseudoalteromonas sp. L23]|nr:hypothetical protein [Pseudoalteromonas sp. L23]
MFLRKLTLIMVFKTVFLANLTIANESTSIPDIPSNAPRKHVPDPRELSNVNSRLQPLDNNLFGERIDYATGSVSFSVTDVTLPHSTLPIEVSRTLGGEQMSWRSKKDFSNWDLSIPHLRTKVAKFKEGGEVDYDYTKYSGNWPKGVACSRQPDLSNVRGRHGTVLSIYEYWAGETIEIPGKGSEIILRSNETNKITTKSQWDVSCADGGYGEGFIVTTLDGTKYEFFTPKYVQNKPVVKGKYEIAEYSEDGDCIFECETYKVATAYLLVDKITDKFGNWLKYDYTDGQLQSISSSDGRKVTFQYSNGLIASINANNRIWKYSYSSGNGSLHKVTRPDSSYWEYSDTYWYHRVPTPYTDHESSPNSPTLSRCVLTDVGMFDDLTITHPNGATGKFTFAERGFGRTSVTDINTGRCFNNFSLIEKEITLSNDKAYKWSFKYLNSMGAFTSERQVSSFPGISNFRLPSIAGLVESDFKAVVVTNPDNSQHRYI